MMLLDSNIVIYAIEPTYAALADFIEENEVLVSAITLVETLGFHRIDPLEKAKLEFFFSGITQLAIEQVILNRAVALRQQRKMSLGDALIAATALEHGLTLVTRNTKDFAWIEGFGLHNPFPDTP